MSRICVARELNGLVVLELESLLEALANLEENLTALLLGPGLARIARDGLADRPRPQTNSIEALANVDNHAHDLVVLLVLKVLADGCKHDVQPERVDVDGLLVLELEGPLAAVLVLGVFPLGSDVLLEEVVVGLEREI